MSLGIRRACLREDRQQLIELLERNIEGEQTRHFAWRHEANPVGPGWSWVIYERRTDAIVAMTSVFPRRMHVCGRPMLCGIVAEFVVDATHRSLGPAVELQRATFEPVRSGEIAFCYDAVPHDRGMSTFVRLGLHPSAELVRYALPLRSDDYLRSRLGSGAWTRPLISGANLILNARKRRIGSTLEITEFGGSFDEEFSCLDQAVANSGIIRSSRTALDLNWRYRGHPDLNHRALVARRQGRLVGFLVFVIFDTIACVIDVFGDPIDIVGAELVDALTDLERKEHRVSLEAYVTPDSPLQAIFLSAGFSQREVAVRFVSYADPPHAIGSLFSEGTRWELGRCDTMM
jgi:hypothetical protein